MHRPDDELEQPENQHDNHHPADDLVHHRIERQQADEVEDQPDENQHHQQADQIHARESTPRRHAPKGPIKARGPFRAADPSRQCTATANRTGQRCQLDAIKGGTVCMVHGGSAPQVQLAAKQRLSLRFDPALAVYDELLEAKDFPTVRFATAREIINHEVGKPGESLAVNVNIDAELLIRLERGRQRNANGDES